MRRVPRKSKRAMNLDSSLTPSAKTIRNGKIDDENTE